MGKGASPDNVVLATEGAVLLVTRVSRWHGHHHEDALARPFGGARVAGEELVLVAVALGVGEARALERVAVDDSVARVVDEDEARARVVYEVMR